MRYIDSLFFTYDVELEFFETQDGIFPSAEAQNRIKVTFDRVESILEDMGINPDDADIIRGVKTMAVILEESAKFTYGKYRALLKKMKAFFAVYNSYMVQYVDNEDFDGPFADFTFGDRSA